MPQRPARFTLHHGPQAPALEASARDRMRRIEADCHLVREWQVIVLREGSPEACGDFHAVVEAYMQRGPKVRARATAAHPLEALRSSFDALEVRLHDGHCDPICLAAGRLAALLQRLRAGAAVPPHGGGVVEGQGATP